VGNLDLFDYFIAAGLPNLMSRAASFRTGTIAFPSSAQMLSVFFQRKTRMVTIRDFLAPEILLEVRFQGPS